MTPTIGQLRFNYGTGYSDWPASTVACDLILLPHCHWLLVVSCNWISLFMDRMIDFLISRENNWPKVSYRLLFSFRFHDSWSIYPSFQTDNYYQGHANLCYDHKVCNVLLITTHFNSKTLQLLG